MFVYMCDVSMYKRKKKKKIGLGINIYNFHPLISFIYLTNKFKRKKKIDIK